MEINPVAQHGRFTISGWILENCVFTPIVLTPGGHLIMGSLVTRYTQGKQKCKIWSSWLQTERQSEAIFNMAKCCTFTQIMLNSQHPGLVHFTTHCILPKEATHTMLCTTKYEACVLSPVT